MYGYYKHENKFPTTVFLNHGTSEKRLALKKAIEAKNDGFLEPHKVTVILPEEKVWYNLNNNKIEKFEENNLYSSRDDSKECKIKLGDVEFIFSWDIPQNELSKIITTLSNNIKPYGNAD